MKILHSGDIHLGSFFSALGNLSSSRDWAVSLRSSFLDMIEFAKKNNIHIILLCGDVFDSDYPTIEDKEFFYNVISANQNIYFLYLRGNHDKTNSFSKKLNNLLTFSDSWSSYKIGDIVFTGREKLEGDIYSSLSLDEKNTNVVLLHGDITGGDYPIDINKLKNKNINYLALGHLHSFQAKKLDERGVFAYSGCLKGRGFDECGDKGFVCVDIQQGRANTQFIKNTRPSFSQVVVDISSCNNSYDVFNKVKNSISIPSNNAVEIVLCGEIDFDNSLLSQELHEFIKSDYYFVRVDDKTTRKIDFSAFLGDVSVKGEFVRCVLENNSISPQDKNEIITLGLNALAKREI